MQPDIQFIDVAEGFLPGVAELVRIQYPNPCFITKGPRSGRKLFNVGGEQEPPDKLYIYVFSRRELARKFLENSPIRSQFLNIVKYTWEDFYAEFSGSVNGAILDFLDDQKEATIIPF